MQNHATNFRRFTSSEEAGPGPEAAELAAAAAAAVAAAYILASSCALTIFFLYRMRLLPNQLET